MLTRSAKAPGKGAHTKLTRVPGVAAGGSTDGRSLLAARALGAAGAQLGIRVLMARESGVPTRVSQAPARRHGDPTVVTRPFSGRPTRGLRNRFAEEYARARAEPLTWLLQRLAADDIYGASQAADKTASILPFCRLGDIRILRAGQGAAGIVSWSWKEFKTCCRGCSA
jgi:NAD(P)H-dependent flavin oxidoreductase YrpB (nitropropane dioxygenase family)